MRRHHRNKKSHYPTIDWKIIEKNFSSEHNHHSETIFSLGNGYIGLRGTYEEGYQPNQLKTTPGSYINGIYESEQIIYGEPVFGMPKTGQTMINLADWKIICLKIQDEIFSMLEGKLEFYERTLDLKEGKLIRKIIWESPKGRRVAITIIRLISLSEVHKAVIRYQVEPLNFSGKLSFSSEINGKVRNYHHLCDQALMVRETDVSSDMGYLLHETKNSKIAIAIAIQHRFVSSDSEFLFQSKGLKNESSISILHEWAAKAGEKYQLDKYISFYTSNDWPKEKLKSHTLNEVRDACDKGFEYLLREQKKFLTDYWQEVDIKIVGDLALQQGVRFNAFQLLQSCGRDGKTGIGAKGLTGEFYEGHYFWDTEIYINPFFLYSKPELVKNLLLFRYNTLDCARERAKLLGYDGALYPWRTINGYEASAFFEGSTAQYHINAAIVYAIYKYVEATDDHDFLIKFAAEIIFETSRLWASLGGFIPLKNNKFCLNEVCGPDEYKSGVNNNCYTNYMARFNLEQGVKVAKMMGKDYPMEFKQLKGKIKLTQKEIENWQLCASEMFLPFNEELKVHPQDDSFLYKEDLVIDDLPEHQLPLLKHWHPLNIWRYQVCKQADVVLLQFLLGDLFDDQIKKANYDYYEPRTTHDSSLSSAIFSIIASEIGYKEAAYNYFMQTARLDLDDYNSNTYEGIHSACMGGSWLCVTHGFAGMRVYQGILHFNPYLPQGWESYQFNIRIVGQKLIISVDSVGVNYYLQEGDKISFWHNDQKINLKKGDKISLLIE